MGWKAIAKVVVFVLAMVVATMVQWRMFDEAASATMKGVCVAALWVLGVALVAPRRISSQRGETK